MAGGSRARIKPPGKTQAERDRIALGRIEAYMDSVVNGELLCPSCNKGMEPKELSTSTVQLLRARYDKLRPSLSAIEQTVINESDRITEAQLFNNLATILQANPDMLPKLIALSQKPETEPSPTTH